MNALVYISLTRLKVYKHALAIPCVRMARFSRARKKLYNVNEMSLSRLGKLGVGGDGFIDHEVLSTGREVGLRRSG